jgi:flagellar hook-associated protein 2
MADYETRLTSIYSAMQTKLSALNATQSYLQQQIDAWNKSDS